MTEEPRSLTLQRRTIPPHVEAAVVTALAKLPADRFQTAAQFAEALSRPGAVTLAQATAARTLAHPVARSRRERALAHAPWLLALLLGGAAAWSWLGRPARPGPSWQVVFFPDGPTPATIGVSLALSPDGSSLVVKDDILNGLLWIKRRGELRPVSIPGTERANNPVFSPDGEWVAFIADGRLKKVRPVGGAAITLADSATGPFGGVAWLDDGTLVYVPPLLSNLMRVSAAGGPSTIAFHDSALAGFGIGAPHALPGSRGVLFTACNSGCVTMGVHVLDLRTGARRLLVDDAVTAWYVPTGQLLYVRRDGAALAAPFDLDRLEIAGAAVPVLEGVFVTNGTAQLALSPAGTLAYLRGTGINTEREAVRTTREGVATPIDTAWHGGFNALALSPDGRRLAIGAGLASGALSIWIKQLDRGPFTRLTFGGQDRRPAWSPDGRVVAFVRDSGNTSAVFARPIDGSSPDRLLARIDRQVQEVTWSPDGRWLVLRTDNGTAGAGDLVGVRTAGDSAPVPLVASEFTELHPAISPDGRWLAYTSNESGTNEVYVRPFPGASGGRWQVSNGGGQQPVWSRDGRELYFVDGPGNLVAAQVRTAPAFEVGESHPLFDLSSFTLDAFHQVYDALPGGRGFVFLRERRSGREAGAPAIVYAEDWFADLRARVRQ